MVDRLPNARCSMRCKKPESWLRRWSCCR